MPVVPLRQERRLYPRIGCEIRDSQGRMLRNVSQGGAYFEADENYSLAQKLQLAFAIPINGEKIQLKAQVLWQKTLSKGYGYGVQFQLDPNEKKSLDYLLASEEYYLKVRDVFFQIIPDEVKCGFSREVSIISDLSVDSLRVAEVAILLEQAFGQPIFLPDWFVSEEKPEDLTIGSLVRFLVKTLQSI